MTDAPKCVSCGGRGWRWGRTRMDEKGRMTKRKCGACGGTGKAKERKL